MEELKATLDVATFKKLLDAKITDDSLGLLTDEEIIDLQIELGPRKIIRNVINQMSLPSTSYVVPKRLSNPMSELQDNNLKSSLIESVEEDSSGMSSDEIDASTTSTAQSVREILEKDKSFRGVLYNKLLANIVPQRKEICRMVYILCESRFHDDMFNKKRNPTFQEKQQLAIDIIKSFPQLKETRPYKLAPPEAAFFWRNGGKGLAKPHTGWIETRVCNKRKDIPKENRKFRRPEKRVQDNVDQSLIDKAKLCSALAANTDNIKMIDDLMKASAPYHLYLIQTQTDARTILQIFPHFCSFSGIMLQQAYERLRRINPKADIRQTLIKCLSVNQLFPDVEDKVIRGALRALAFLNRRGTKKENAEPIEQTATECFASKVIRWFEPNEGWETNVIPGSGPYIICLAPPLRQGEYYVNLQGKFVFCGIQAARSVDILIKSFEVLGTKPSGEVAKLIEFLEIFTYSVTRFSSRMKVNSLVNRLRELEDEDEKPEEIGAVQLVPMP